MSTKSKKGRRGPSKEKKYSSDDLISAIAAVQDGMSQREASRTWKIPRTTLIDSIKEKYTVGKHLPGK